MQLNFEAVLVQVLFRELDDKSDEANTLLTTAEKMLSDCVTDSELRDVVVRLKVAVLDTRDVASKSKVSIVISIMISSLDKSTYYLLTYQLS